MKEYKLKGKKGIDDLQGLYAFVSNSQGDTSGTNALDVYLMSDGWLSFVFNCKLTQEAINKEVKRRFEANTKYISYLASEGKYGEEYEISIKLEENPLFDSPNINKPLESYSSKIFDVSE